MVQHSNIKKWAMILLAFLVTATWQSSCKCRSNAAAKAAFFAPGSIKFQRVYK